MTNKEAIEELSGMYRLCVIDSLDGTIEAEKKNTAIDIAIKALEEQDKHRWIPVSERLPENERPEYLCCNDNGYIYIYGYSKNLYRIDKYEFIQFKNEAKKGFYDYDSEWGYRYCDDVVAWMSLPEPYKQESEEE